MALCCLAMWMWTSRPWLFHRAFVARLGPRPLLPARSPLHSSASARGDVGHKDFFRDPFVPYPVVQLSRRWNQLKELKTFQFRGPERKLSMW